MPTKTTHKPGAKKPDDAKPARTAAAKPTLKAAAEKAKPVKAEAPAAPKVVQETVSLIDAKPKTRRVRTATELENKPFAHIPISRILEPEAPKAAAPAPEAPAVPEAPAAPVA